MLCYKGWEDKKINMRLSISKSKNSISLYVIKSTYENGVHSSKIVEKLGTYDELKRKLDDQDPIEWAKKYIEKLNREEKEGNRDVIVKYSQSKLIQKGKQHSFNGGYLFLQQIYYELGLDKLCTSICRKYKFTFDLNSILSRLLYSRIIYPSSKLATFELSKRFIEQPDFELQHIYRALTILAKESDFIQSELYNNSLKISKRNTSVLYYDCTNYFFEIEQEEGLKQYGFGKDHKPNPIVQMGLFMDGDGIPLAFCIDKGNANEQLTLTPLEKQILSDFKLSKFVVCTDAGLSSINNRKFNDRGDRAFITTQSVKKLKKHIKDWALDTKGWLLDNSGKTYDISDVDEEKYKDKVFYKERWINEDGLEQRLIITYSIKYRDYQHQIRCNQIDRAIKAVDNSPAKLKYLNQNDYKRFILKTHYTPDGEIAQKEALCIDTKLIAKEEAFDGFYAVCTNLEDDASAIIKINKKRWEIEECFRIMKSEFKARPVHLSRDDRIQAHFMTCFIALIIYRLLEKRLGGKYTCHEILSKLREMNFYHIPGEGYIPTFTRTDFTDDLHEAFGFRTDYQIISTSNMRKIIKITKS
jgi:transposase